MKISDSDSRIGQIGGQTLCHFLSEGSDKGSLFFGCHLLQLSYEVVYLPFCFANLDWRIQKTGRSDNLLRRNAACHLPLNKAAAWR